MRTYLGLACLIAFGSSASQVRAASHEVNFLVVGDWGTGSGDQRRIAERMAASARALDARFVISTGDNFYSHGLASASDAQFQMKFEAVYDDPALMIPWYVVLGNHDHGRNATAEIGHPSRNDRWQMPAAYYKHTEALEGGVTADFFFIDSEAIRTRYQSWMPHLTPDPQVAWLDRELASSKSAWKIVVGHHPVHSGGMHSGETALIRELQPLFRKYGVQAYLNGHDHDLEDSVEGATHYLTSGAGAQARSVKTTAGARFIAGNTLGFMTARLQAAAMDIAFLDDNGTTLYSTKIERDMPASRAASKPADQPAQ
jgi:tartrate-resistant acid phosphatase type 5